LPDKETVFTLVKWLVSVLAPAASGLLGVWLGSVWTSKRERARRAHEFVARQLSEFYSPLLALRSEMAALNDLEWRIAASENKEWQELCAHYKTVEGLQRLMDARGDDFVKYIDYNNRRLREHVLPAYRQMIALFRERRWLAQASTVEHLPALLEFVDIWDRSLSKTITRETLAALNHTEKSLDGLWEDLEKTHEELRLKLAEGSA
jgi:hypothetical protein